MDGLPNPIAVFHQPDVLGACLIIGRERKIVNFALTRSCKSNKNVTKKNT